MKKRLFKEEEEEEDDEEGEEGEEGEEFEEPIKEINGEENDSFDELDVSYEKLKDLKKTEIKKASKSFISNECPDELKKKIYIPLKFKSASRFEEESGYTNRSSFRSSRLIHIFFAPVCPTLLMILFSILFYYLLITYILYRELKLLILLIIVYIIGTFYQVLVVPEPKKFRPKVEFEELLTKLLNSSIQIKFYHQDKIKATYQAKYTIDMTGILNIPSKFQYASIKGVQGYSKNDIYTLVNNFNSTYGSKNSKIKTEIIYKREKINFDSNIIYSISSNTDLYSINFLTTFFSLLLLQWIYSLYYDSSDSKGIVEIYLTKLIINDLVDSPSKITIHGKNYLIDSFIKSPISSNYQLDKDYRGYLRKVNEQKRQEQERIEKERRREEKRRQEEEKKRQEKERKEKAIRDEKERNTKILSRFNNENYTITVKKFYDKVSLSFRGYARKKIYEYDKELGVYDPSCKERIIEKDQLTIYYPNGFDIRIEVQRGLTSYTINIGTEYTKNINYYYD